MVYFFTIILGLVQGLTEFLPVSSSGHLIFLHDILDLQTIDNLSFDVALHLGTLVALIVYFYKDIIRYLRAFLKSLVNWNLKNELDQRIAWLILISMIPAALIGFFFEEVLENVFRAPLSVALVLIIVSLLFFIAEKFSQKIKNFDSLNWWKVILIGIAQALALIPGVSRSGITIITGMAFNLKRQVAARFSFLMAIPIVLAAGIKKTYDASQLSITSNDILMIVLGFLTAAIVGFFTIRYFLKFLQKYSLNYFAIYRIILGVIILIYLYLK
jgi:undecaprenyl-diphosphatase